MSKNLNSRKELFINQHKKIRIAGKYRIAVVVASVVLQILLIVLLVRLLSNYAIFVYFIIQIIALIDIVFIADRRSNRSFIISWLLVISILPIFGHILYFMWGRCPSRDIRSKRIKDAIARGVSYLIKEPQIYSELGDLFPSRKRIAGYLGRKNFPLYKNTDCQYFPLGELQYEAMLHDMEKAEKFIFMEYFTLSSGRIWDKFEDVLVRKARQGVEIRLMYDDLGSIITAPDDLPEKLKAFDIQVAQFNPVQRHISRLYINYRNHQKITVIDGNIAYTGGANLADQYANLFPKHGHWKDTAIRLEGDAVWSLTVAFLQMWESESEEKIIYANYRPSKSSSNSAGYYQPFTDGPVNNPDNPAEVLYRKLINNAKNYVYITTPYLIIDNTMMDSLCNAALGGTDVRIITPKIWDQWYVHMVTQSNYGELLRSGVRVYEYTPGFIHAKTIISDDEHAVTGTINMDYRSFYLHYENGVWICGSPVLADIKNDIMDTFDISEEIQLEAWSHRPLRIKIIQAVLRLFAVLL